MNTNRGAIWVAFCPKPEGKTADEKTNIQYGVRVIAIVGNEKANQSEMLTVVKGTGQLKNLNQPTRVLVEGFGLKQPTVFMAEQIGPLDKKNLMFYVGQLDDETIAAIDRAIKIHTGLFEPFSIDHVKALIDDINEIDRFFNKYRITEEESIIRTKRMKELESYCAEYGYKHTMFLQKYLEYSNTREVNLCG